MTGGRTRRAASARRAAHRRDGRARSVGPHATAMPSLRSGAWPGPAVSTPPATGTGIGINRSGAALDTPLSRARPWVTCRLCRGSRDRRGRRGQGRAELAMAAGKHCRARCGPARGRWRCVSQADMASRCSRPARSALIRWRGSEVRHPRGVAHEAGACDIAGAGGIRPRGSPRRWWRCCGHPITARTRRGPCPVRNWSA